MARRYKHLFFSCTLLFRGTRGGIALRFLKQLYNVGIHDEILHRKNVNNYIIIQLAINMFLTGLYEDFLHDVDFFKTKSQEEKAVMIKSATESLSTSIRDSRARLQVET